MTLDDPYRPPASDLAPSVRVGFRPTRLGYLWLVGFGLNLIVPTMFAWGLLDAAGWLGLIGAVAMLGAGGFGVLIWRRSWARPAVNGAFLMAITQLLPIIQISLGMVAVSIARDFTSHRSLASGSLVNDGLLRRSGIVVGFMATLGTGIPLLAASMGLGYAIDVFSNNQQGQKTYTTTTTD